MYMYSPDCDTYIYIYMQFVGLIIHKLISSLKALYIYIYIYTNIFAHSSSFGWCQIYMPLILYRQLASANEALSYIYNQIYLISVHKVMRMHRIRLNHRDRGDVCMNVPVNQTNICSSNDLLPVHDDVIKWKHFPRYWPFVREIHRSPVNFPHKGQWRGALMFTLICARMNGWVNNREAGDLRRYLVHYDVIVMSAPNHFNYHCLERQLHRTDLC